MRIVAQLNGDSPSLDQGPAIHGVGGTNAIGVFGQSGTGPAVQGISVSGDGVVGISYHGGAAIRGVAEHKDQVAAGLFEGNVGVLGNLEVRGNIFCTGDVQLTGHAQDLAEPFTVEGPEEAWPGAVVVLTGHDRVRVADAPYDPRVAGVISGAGNLRPGIVLGRHDDADERPTIALTGKVWCSADASHGPIRLGDLLTTSSTPGYAMRVSDHVLALGSVVGKALAELSSGRGLIPVLVSLR
jgi:hypothetical protein